MAQNKGLIFHQYLEDWLLRATSHQTCLYHTQSLVAVCQDLGWIENLENQNWNPDKWCQSNSVLQLGGQGQTHSLIGLLTASPPRLAPMR